MKINVRDNDYKKQTRLINVVGALLMLSGIAIGFLGLLEMYCFYLFSEGGRFYYEGFGFGSFMFGNIASQVIGYYVISIIFIILGYGHLKARRWVRKITLSLSWTWLVVGAPLVIIIFFILTGTKNLSLFAQILSAVFLGLTYLVFPWLAIRFYGGQKIIQYFESKGTERHWTDNIPIPILVLSMLYIFFIIVLHILILFKGMFPIFGVFATGLKGIILLDISIMCLIFLIWGLINLRMWAWWGSVIFFGLFTFSTILTFLRTSYLNMLSLLEFPPREMEFLSIIPIEGYHLACLTGIPLLVTWLIAVLSKGYFKRGY